MRAKLERDAKLHETIRLVNVGRRISDCHMRATRNQKLRRRDAAAASADDRHSLSTHAEGFHRLPQLQRCQTQQRENDRDDLESRDHLRLGPADELEVMVNRRHAKHAFARELE